MSTRCAAETFSHHWDFARRLDGHLVATAWNFFGVSSGLRYIIMDPRGDQVYMTGTDVAAFDRDLVTGHLALRDLQGRLNFGELSVGALSPDGRHLYQPAGSQNALRVYDTGRAAPVLLLGSRFRVSVQFATGGAKASASPVALTPDSAYFWFFHPANVELVVKVLDGCVFLSGLTNVEVDVIVTDTVTGGQRRYTNPRGVTFSPRLDTNAFDTCP